MKKIFSLLLLAALLCAPLSVLSASDWNWTRAVINAETSDRVHLRAGPSTGYASLGLYFTGTEVEFRAVPGSEWSEVTIGTEHGYMMSRFLTTAAAPRQPAARINIAAQLRYTPNADSGSGLTLPAGTYVWLLGETNSRWYYVQAGLECGYIPEDCLTLAEGMSRPGYDEILAQYAAAVRTCSSDGFWWVNGEGIMNYAGYGAELGYTLLDVDGNGVDELIVGERSQSDFSLGMIYNLYTLNNGYPRTAINGWVRNAYYLCADGQFLNEWSNGAGNSGWSVYGLENGQPVFRYGIVFDSEGPCGDDHPWYSVTAADRAPSAANTVSESAASKTIASLEGQILSPQLMPFH